MNKILLKTLLLGSCFCSYVSWAQDLNLFQATENPNGEEENTRRAQRASRSPADPVFTLVGTSRFGDKYYASLLNRDGNKIRVEWSKGRVQPVKGYINYGIAQIASRSVSLRLPVDEPCIANEDKGVTCNGNIALLTLSTADALAPRHNVNPAGSGRSGSGDAANEPASGANTADGADSEFNQETIEGTNVLVRNPFSGELQTAPQLTQEEIAAREERRQRRAEQFSDFRIERIADDEIPEGMRRVRTPFGDQLEPIEN